MMIPLTAILCPLLVLAFIVAIIVLIVRSAGRKVSSVAAGAARPPVNVITQLAPDGFWLSSFEPGAVVYYQYWAGGAMQPGHSVFQPGNDGRQFVYTGARPENVEIVRVVSPSGSITTGPGVYVEDDSPDFVTPIAGALAAEAVIDAMTSSMPEAPAPPSPPQFPAAY